MNKTARKTLKIATKVLTWLLISFAVFMMIFTVFTVSTLNKNDRSLFGLRFYVVQSDSMSLSDKNAHMDVHFRKDDIILVTEPDDKAALKPGQIISFVSTNAVSYGETVTHMIREVKYNDDGSVKGYITFGTHTDTNDEALVEPDYVLGTYWGKLAGVGKFFEFVRSTPGYIVCILIPFLLLILYNGLNVIRLFRRYKREQMENMEMERHKLEEERAENRRMLEELMALKAQMSGQATDSPSQESDGDLQ